VQSPNATWPSLKQQHDGYRGAWLYDASEARRYRLAPIDKAIRLGARPHDCQIFVVGAGSADDMFDAFDFHCAVALFYPGLMFDPHLVPERLVL